MLQKEWWIFGGRFVDLAARRQFAVLDQFDLPLIRADGTLHVVELKLAAIPQLVIPHRSHLIVGKEISEAAGQTMNYLRTLDEQRAEILATFGIDCRRSFATIVIGHPAFVSQANEEAIYETIRTYNSHLSRLEVVTYKELTDSAERMLASESAPVEP